MFFFDQPAGFTVKELLALDKAYRRKNKPYRILILVLRILMFVLGAVNLVLFFVTLGYGAPYVLSLVIGIAGLLLGFFRGYLSSALRSRSSRKTMPAFTMRLGDEQMEEQAGEICSVVPYSTISAVFRSEEAYFLFVSERRSLVLRISCLKEGSPSDLDAFLAEKTGKPVQYIH